MTQRLEAEGNKYPESQDEWDDGSGHDDVTKIFVRGCSQGIQYIQFSYIKDGQPIYGSVHGFPEQGFTQTYEINHLRGEHLESVEGYYESRSNVIQGIQFKTNLRISELIGFEKHGTKFSLSVDGKKIIGFHGSAKTELNYLGAYFTWITPTRLEAQGRKGGEEWNDGSDHDGVTKIHVRGCYDIIQYVKFDYVKDGQDIYGSVHGASSRAGYTQTVCIYDFVLESKGCAIVGFHGRSADVIRALGAYCRPLPPLPEAEKLQAHGGDGGASWDDGGFDGIRNIYIGQSEMGISFLKFLYHKDDQAVVGDDHGSKTLTGDDDDDDDDDDVLISVLQFELESPCEYLISVEGKYDVVDGSESGIIRMLRFKTNMRTSQVFGLETTSNFTLEKECHKIVGFHGKVSNMLTQIGVHVLPLSEQSSIQTLSS
ncbi:unnamed protein product [Microthlaspi erraticum]|uniref:Jacalin-type lectin domain-containing protein n=1 Tax=Microthlaspi erraticum TaxID=1685480 RepID=A0A6D2JVR9_9BRAS|nr:unnamed protein product [Microthlaspi erraticum]